MCGGWGSGEEKGKVWRGGWVRGGSDRHIVLNKGLCVRQN